MKPVRIKATEARHHFAVLLSTCIGVIGCTGCDADNSLTDPLQVPVDRSSSNRKPEGPTDGMAADMSTLDAFPVPKPPFSWGVYPCSTCHSVLKDNFVKRTLVKEHTYIHLNHGPREKWCFDCHDQYNRDKLKLSSGSLIRFDESYKLCGQCHGPKYRDWRAGVHGKRTGYWNGIKQYLLCANCHDPHNPHFKPIAPEPPPVHR